MNKSIFQILLYFILYSICLAGNVPQTADIESTYQQCIKTYNVYKEQTLDIRIGYEFFGSFSDNGKIGLLWKMSQNCVNNIRQIIDVQQDYLIAIENYEGDDWSEKFSDNGLWEKLKANIANCNFLILDCLSDYASTLGKKESEELKTKLLSDKLWQEGLDQTVYGKLLKFGLLHQSDDVGILEDIFGKTDDVKVKIIVAGRAYRIGNKSLLEQILIKYPQSKDNICKIFYDYAIKDLDNLGWIGSLELPLICSQSLHLQNQQSLKLIQTLADSNKYNDYLLYKTAAEIYNDYDPIRSLNYFLIAAKCSNKPKDYELLLQWASDKAFSMWTEKKIDCSMAKEIFQSVSDKSPLDSNYRYAIIIDECGDKNSARNILEKVASSSTEYANYAKYKLITDNLDIDSNDINKLRLQITSLIVDSKAAEQKDIVERAVLILGQLILNNYDPKQAQYFLDNCPTDTNNVDILIMQATAYTINDDFENAISRFVTAILKGRPNCPAECVEILDKILQKTEYFMDKENTTVFLENCLLVADFGLATFDHNLADYLEPYYLELAALTNSIDEKSLCILSKIQYSETIESLRAKARYAYWKKEYENAGKCWANICLIKKRQEPQSYTANQQWQQAKYNEFLCMSKIDNLKSELSRATKIMLNSYSDKMEGFWLMKIKEIDSN